MCKVGSTTIWSPLIPFLMYTIVLVFKLEGSIHFVLSVFGHLGLRPFLGDVTQ